MLQNGLTAKDTHGITIEKMINCRTSTGQKSKFQGIIKIKTTFYI